MRKSYKLVSKVDNSWKFLEQFIKIKSMQIGLPGFLQRVYIKTWNKWCFKRFCEDTTAKN